MPWLSTDPDVTQWSYGCTILGKVSKPGSKAVVQGNGRVSLRFTVQLECGTPFEAAKYFDVSSNFTFRCIWFDPDFMLNTNDVVEATGKLTWSGKNLGLLVNKAKVIARFVPARLAGPSKQPQHCTD